MAMAATKQLHPHRRQVERPSWPEPRSLQECEERMEDLLNDFTQIQVQLANRNRTDGQGSRWDSEHYHDWRAKALTAHTLKVGEYRFLKKWKKEHLKTVREEMLERVYQKAFSLISDDSESNFQELERVVYETHKEVPVPPSLTSVDA